MNSLHQLAMNIAIGCAGGAAILKLLNWFMTELQKKVLSDLSLRMWNFLDDAKKTRLLLNFRSGRPQFFLAALSIIFGLSFIILFVNFLWPPPVPINMFVGSNRLANALIAEAKLGFIVPASGLIAGAILTTFWILPPVLRWLSRARSQMDYLGRWYKFLVCSGLAGGILSIPLGFVAVASSSNVLLAAVVFLGAAYDACLAVLMFLGVLTLIAGLSLQMGRGVLIVGEYIMRRIAEASAGPLLAASALIGGVAAIIKAFA
jgi:hypothetical protein